MCGFQRWRRSGLWVCAALVLGGLGHGVTAGDLGSASPEPRVEWVRAGLNTNQPIWGMRGHLLFALHPGGFTDREGGPRGLIRLGYPTLTNGGYDLINFIAVEPVAGGKKGFSELEQSALDQRPGKRMWAGDGSGRDVPSLDSGQLRITHGVEQLELSVSVERFDNGAHVRLRLVQRSDRPDELMIRAEAEPGSAAIDYCILTATMGNKARVRHLWLNDGPVSSHTLYPDYAGVGFAPHRLFALDRLHRNPAGDVVVAITTDEETPASVQPFGRPHFWDYRGAKVTQYWRMPAACVTSELLCAVNGRFTYWGSQQPIPGGISFENFELRQKFRSNDWFVFGITRKPPEQIVPRRGR